MVKTLLEVIHHSAEFLAKYGVSRPRREAEEVIADVLHVRRMDLYLRFDTPLNNEELKKLRLAVQRRGKREPRAYIIGEVEFAGVQLSVSPAVLIPRLETEILVAQIIQVLTAQEKEEKGNRGKVLWDLCCGSGCIGIALKKRFPELHVIGTDLSSEALIVARANACKNQVEVDFRQGDLFDPFQSEVCDYFICNPPYISEQEYQSLEPEVRIYEPKIALVGGETGYEYYRKIASALPSFLRPSGKGWLEIGSEQRVEVSNLFLNHGFECHSAQDWSGRDRFIFLEKS